MATLIASKTIESIVRNVLVSDGYKVSVERANGGTGTDIVAERGTEVLHIEAISFKASGPARSKDFYEVFFRAISRIELGATLCVIVLPSRFGKGLPQRVKALGRAWKRIGVAFPELAVWLQFTFSAACFLPVANLPPHEFA